MDSLLNRIRRSLAVRGPVGTARLCASELAYRVLPGGRRAEAARKNLDQVFDAALGVDTGGIFRPNPGAVVGNHWQHGVNYQAVVPGDFLRTLIDAEVDYQEFSFVDLGCGKGRALILAAVFPFRRVVGVEYCPALCQVARANISRLSGVTQCSQVEVLNIDAVDFRVPDGPLLLFMYNPFGQVVMREVVNRVSNSFQESPRRVVVVYFTPECRQIWEETGIFKLRQPSPAILDTGPVLTRVGTAVGGDSENREGAHRAGARSSDSVEILRNAVEA